MRLAHLPMDKVTELEAPRSILGLCGLCQASWGFSDCMFPLVPALWGSRGFLDSLDLQPWGLGCGARLPLNLPAGLLTGHKLSLQLCVECLAQPIHQGEGYSHDIPFNISSFLRAGR